MLVGRGASERRSFSGSGRRPLCPEGGNLQGHGLQEVRIGQAVEIEPTIEVVELVEQSPGQQPTAVDAPPATAPILGSDRDPGGTGQRSHETGQR